MTLPQRVAICPGSFDPITLGHEDIIRRALRLADRVIVAVGHQASQTKKGLFAVDERLRILEEVFTGEDRVEVADFQGLLVDFARERGATLVVRGLRGVADFEYEFQMALMNRKLDPQLETVFLAPDPSVSFVSSTLVRQIAALGGDPAPFVSPGVLERLRGRFPGATR
jgi:pantetheine-phosphate adenylyltransferase